MPSALYQAALAFQHQSMAKAHAYGSRLAQTLASENAPAPVVKATGIIAHDTPGEIGDFFKVALAYQRKGWRPGPRSREAMKHLARRGDALIKTNKAAEKKRLARQKSVWDDIADGAISVMKSPVFSAVVGIATAAIPGIGLALAPIAVAVQRGVTNMVDKARHGDLEAKDALDTVVNVAASGAAAASPAMRQAIDEGRATVSSLQRTAKTALAVARTEHEDVSLVANLRASRALVLRAKAGDEKAIQRLRQIAHRARSGDHHAVKALAHITAIVHGMATGHVPMTTEREHLHFARLRNALGTYKHIEAPDEDDDTRAGSEADSDDGPQTYFDVDEDQEDDASGTEDGEAGCTCEGQDGVGNGFDLHGHTLPLRAPYHPAFNLHGGKLPPLRAPLRPAFNLHGQKLPALRSAAHPSMNLQGLALRAPAARAKHASFQGLPSLSSHPALMHPAFRGLPVRSALQKGALHAPLRHLSPELAHAMMQGGAALQPSGARDEGGDDGSEDELDQDGQAASYGYADDMETDDRDEGAASEPGTYGDWGEDEDPRDETDDDSVFEDDGDEDAA